MVTSYDPTWTAVTAEMEFLGESVGELQDFSVDENFNVQRMVAIGSPVDVKHIPGVYQATITARRAFLDMNAVFSAITTIDASKMAGAVDSATGTIPDLDKLKSALQNTTLGTNMVIASLDFDVTIFEKYIASGATTPTKRTRYTFNSCTVNSRSMSVSAGNIIVMENVNILARSRTLGPNTLYAG